MEEDAGKLVHSGTTIKDSSSSNVDYNRTGVPLIEIVSEPDMHSPAEARAYMEKIKSILQYIDVSNCKMEEGNLRADVNVSLRPEGSEKLGTKVEMKNLNSFKVIEDALEYEIERQNEVLEDGGILVQETRTWDDGRGITLSMRSKKKLKIIVICQNLTLCQLLQLMNRLKHIKKNFLNYQMQEKLV